ncbi:MAG: alpha/beta hydrolase-fold protein [Bacteroidetes bacterium]|nr:alpha/beta hydrolase-fold protein [Bacteroidota bacterium]
MKKLLILVLFAAFGIHVQGQTFARFLTRINSLPEGQRQAVADSFMNAGSSFPFTEEDTLVHFVYNSAAQSVDMAGDATGWNPNISFTNIPGTTFRYFSTNYETDARLDYKFVINGSNWILDPRNPNTCIGGYGPNSELRMPGYLLPPEIAFYAVIPHGTISDTTFYSSSLGNSRPVKVYLPPGYPSGSNAYPVILFHDGPEYLGLGKTANIFDYLISEHLMTPVIGVFVPPVDRSAEYAGSKIDKFTEFINGELMPVIDARYKTSKDPSRRAMAGASDGGNISLYIGMKHPEQFGKIAAQSSDVIPVISQTFSTGPKLNLELYIDIGTYDIAALIPMVHGLRDILQAKGYNYQFREWHEGHSWGNWKGHLGLVLMQFFPWSSGLNDTPGNRGLKLDQNRPNPFHGHTMIPFSAPAGSTVELTLFDLNGRKVETIFSGSVSTSNNIIEYRHTQPAGGYILTLKEGETFMDSKIIQAL